MGPECCQQIDERITVEQVPQLERGKRCARIDVAMEINVCEVVASGALHHTVVSLQLPAEEKLGGFQVHIRVSHPQPLEKRLKPVLLGDGETCTIVNLPGANGRRSCKVTESTPKLATNAIKRSI